MKYLHKFNSVAEFEAAYNNTGGSESEYIEPWVSLTIDAVNDVNKVDYNKKPTYDFIVTMDGVNQANVVDNIGFMSDRNKFIDISKTYRVHVIQIGNSWSDGEYDGTMTGEDVGDDIYVWSVTPDDSGKTSVSCGWDDYDPNNQHAYFYIAM